MNKQLKALLLIAALGLSGAANAFPPYTTATSNAQAGGSNFASAPPPDNKQQSHSGSTPSSVQSSSSNSGTASWGDSFTSSAAASASSEIGRLRMFGTASATANKNYPNSSYVATNARGFATARWDDNFTINGGALNGQIGHLSAGFLVDGYFTSGYDASVTSSASLVEYFRASLRLVNGSGSGQDLTVNGGQQYRVNYNGGNWGTYSSEPFRAPGVWSVEFDFKFGTPIQISGWGDLMADANVFATNPYPTSSIMATADFSHTMAWNGIAGITDSLGNPVTNYTVSSGSGFDYSQAAVPIPTAVWLFGSGLLGLVGVARRGRRVT